MRKLALVLAIPLLLAACAQNAPSATGVAGGASRDLGQPAAVDEAKSGAGGAPANQGIPNPIVVSPDRNLILTAKIAMRSKDPWATSDRAQAIATSLGGDVLSLSQSGSGDNRMANVTMRVPSARFGDAIQQIKALDGEVDTSNVSAQDVTDQFVDLQARLTAKQAEEQRYTAILARANTIDEILKVDAALANVRTQIEQLTAQINSIKTRTDYSTISLSVTPIAILPGETAKSWDPAKTVARALAALAAMLQVFGDLAIWLLVFGWIPLLALAIAFVATRARRPSTPSPPAPVSTS
jgi:hypothetical protein